MIGKTISHFKILEKLGAGGMGEVYLAEDTELDRKVALKFLLTQYTSDPEAVERFKREAKAAASLNHPNIITVYEVGEHEGQTFIAMEYVNGESLRDRMKQQLSPNESVELVSQVCDGLSKAHKADIVHRDLKPENIMIDEDGRVRILDFGLAKLRNVSKLTQTATTLGTLNYMSPEQLQGMEVDHRTDIWSVGVVLYEMITGQLPFQGEYEASFMYSVLHEEPEPLSTVQPDLPAYIGQIIDKILEKDQTTRYQNIQAVLNDLKQRSKSVIPSIEPQKSIVVLPFEDMSPGKDNEYFSDGLTEEIISDLSKIHSLRVISRTSAMMLKGTKKDIKTIGKELNVEYLLEGSVRKADNNLRITAQLIEVSSDSHLWAQKYSGTLDDIFDIQEKVSRSIVEQLKLKLTPEEGKRIAERKIENALAYDYYLRAMQEMWRYTEDGFAQALRYLQNGVDIVGENALFYAGMGLVYYYYFESGVKPDKKCLTEAEKFAEKVFELEPESHEAHLITGFVQFKQEGKIKQAAGHLKQALEIEPNDPMVLGGLCYIYSVAGRAKEAIPLAERLVEIDPLTGFNQCMPGFAHAMNGSLELALEPYRKMYQIDPDNPAIRFYYAYVLALNKKFNEVDSILESSMEELSENPYVQMGLIYRHAVLQDRTSTMDSITKAFKNMARTNLEFSYWLAQSCSLINEKEDAIDWIQIAVNLGFINYPFISKYEPLFENIRGEERFKKLMQIVKSKWENFTT